MSLKSSTSTISVRRAGGVLLITLRIVRRSVERASLWKQMITLVVGRSWSYTTFLHLNDSMIQHDDGDFTIKILITDQKNKRRAFETIKLTLGF